MKKRKKCHDCRKTLKSNHHKQCDDCLIKSWRNAEGAKKSSIHTLIKNRGLKVKYVKRCSCGSMLESNHQKQCTDCLLDEMCALVKSGQKPQRIIDIYNMLNARGYERATVDKIVMEELKNE